VKKKQIRITADLIARGLNYFEELNIPFVVCFEGINQMFGNVPNLHKAAILERQYQLNLKIQEMAVEDDAEKLNAIPKSDGDGGLTRT
jgi:hypothetical protein